MTPEAKIFSDLRSQRLSNEEFFDIIDLALWAGQMMLQYGAETERVEITVFRLGVGLGVNMQNILVSHNAIMITIISGGEFRTKIRRVVRQGVNFDILSDVNRIAYHAYKHKIDRKEVRKRLTAASSKEHQYSRWQVALMVGAACGAFSQLFGGSVVTFFVVWLAASLAMLVRQELTKHHYNPLLITTGSAFVATMVGGVAVYFQLEPSIVLASSVLLLIPGVPLINSAEDLIKGFMVIGVTRGVMGLLTSLAIAIGMMFALQIIGFEKLL